MHGGDGWCKSLPKIQRFYCGLCYCMVIEEHTWLCMNLSLLLLLSYIYGWTPFPGTVGNDFFCYFLGIFLVVNLASGRWDPKLHTISTVYSFLISDIPIYLQYIPTHLSIYVYYFFNTHICDICQCSIHDLLQSRHPSLEDPSSSGSHHFRECANFQLHGINKTKSLPNALSARCLVIWCRCSTISFYRQRISSS